MLSYRHETKQPQQSTTTLFTVQRRCTAKHAETNYTQVFIKLISMGKRAFSVRSRETTGIKAAKSELSSKMVCCSMKQHCLLSCWYEYNVT